jgi:PAS domain-containing protein
LFHLSVEIFSALISFAILMISINTYNISKNDFFMFLGIGYTFVGMLDLLHAFSYSTMDIMPNASVNMVAQFWESARLYELVTVLISSLIVRKKIVKPNYLLTVLFQLLIFICIIWANVNLNSMPILRYESGGQTNLKIMIDYMISFGFLICTVTFYKARKLMDKSTFYYIELSLILKVIYELLFTLYFTDTDITSVFGHLFKVLSFYFIYRGIIVNGLQRPFNLLTCTLGNADSTIREKEEQRQFMEDAISRNEQCYNLIIDNSGDGIVIAVDDRLIYANTTAVKKFEANDVTELIGMKLTDLIHEDFTAKTDERIAQFIKSKMGTPFIEII